MRKYVYYGRMIHFAFFTSFLLLPTHVPWEKLSFISVSQSIRKHTALLSCLFFGSYRSCCWKKHLIVFNQHRLLHRTELEKLGFNIHLKRVQHFWEMLKPTFSMHVTYCQEWEDLCQTTRFTFYKQQCTTLNWWWC